MVKFHNLTRLYCTAWPALAAIALLCAPPPRLCAQNATAAEPDSPVHLTLPEAIDLAIAHNHKLELARLSVRDSQEQKRIVQSHYYPELDNSSAVHHITALEGIVLSEGILSKSTVAGPVPSDTLRIDQGASTSYTSGTNLAQPLTQMFKIHAGVKAADADLNAAKIHVSDAENGIALQVHQLYYRYLIEQLNGSTAKDELDAAQVKEDENQRGVRDEHLLLDVELGSRAAMLEDKRAVLISSLNLDDLTLQLDDLLGLPLGSKLDLDPNELGTPPALPARTEAITGLLEKSPEVLSAKQNVEKAKAGLSAAHDAYIPNVTGVAHYSYQSGLPFLEHNFGTFGASFTYDLFDGGAREANVRDARIKLSMAETQLAQTENDVRIQISAAYDKVEQLEELLNVSRLTLETREESYRIGTQRAQVNAELASGVATAHAAVSTAKLNVLSSELSLYLAQNDIKRQLGEMPR